MRAVIEFDEARPGSDITITIMKPVKIVTTYGMLRQTLSELAEEMRAGNDVIRTLKEWQ